MPLWATQESRAGLGECGTVPGSSGSVRPPQRPWHHARPPSLPFPCLPNSPPRHRLFPELHVTIQNFWKIQELSETRSLQPLRTLWPPGAADKGACLSNFKSPRVKMNWGGGCGAVNSRGPRGGLTVGEI